MTAKYWRFIILLVCLSGSTAVQSKTADVYPGMPLSNINEYADVFQTISPDLSPDQIVNFDRESNEDRQPKGTYNFGFSSNTYWVNFTLRNTSDETVELIIEQDYPLIDYVDLWHSSDNQNWNRYQTGDRLPFEARPIAGRTFLFPITIEANSQQQIVMRYRSEGAINIGLRVSDQKDFHEGQALSQLIYGGYYGGFLVLVIYNLIIFTAIKDRIYVYYMAFAIHYGLYMSFHNGLAAQYLLPNNPLLANHLLLIVLAIALMAGAQFARLVCNLRQHLPKFDQATKWLLWFCLVLLAITPIFSYKVMVEAWSLTTTVLCIWILIFGVMSSIKGEMASRYFLVAWATLLISALIYMFKTFGFLPHNGFTQNSFQIGSLVEMILLSVALGARYSEMQKIGYSDSLSTLGNRRQFNEKLPMEFLKAETSGQPLSLILIDIDHFKKVNDTYGHSVGDDVLRAVGKLLRFNVRKPNFACRYGGEEFSILLPHTHEEEAEKAAERIRHTLEKNPAGSLNITVSIGVASTTHPQITTPQRLIEAADKALYQAKHSGRNQVVAFTSQPQQDLSAVKA